MFAQDEHGVDPRMNIAGGHLREFSTSVANRVVLQPLRRRTCNPRVARHDKSPGRNDRGVNLRRIQLRRRFRYLPVSMAFGLPEPIDGMTPLLPTWLSFSPMEVRIASLIDILYWPTFTKSRYVPLMVTVGVVM